MVSLSSGKGLDRLWRKDNTSTRSSEARSARPGAEIPGRSIRFVERTAGARIPAGAIRFANLSPGQKTGELPSLKDQTGADKVEASLRRHAASSMDAVMCAMINGIQWTLRKHVCTAEEFDAYLLTCEPLSRKIRPRGPASF